MFQDFENTELAMKRFKQRKVVKKSSSGGESSTNAKTSDNSISSSLLTKVRVTEGFEISVSILLSLQNLPLLLIQQSIQAVSMTTNSHPNPSYSTT